MAPKRKLDWACRCGRAFATTSQLLSHRAQSRQKACKFTDAQPPPPVAHKRQKSPEQHEPIREQHSAGRVVLQHLQPLRCDSLDALFGEQQLPCVEDLPGDGMFDDGQQVSQADLTASSLVISPQQQAAARPDAPSTSKHTSTSDHAQTNPASIVGTPAAAVFPVSPGTASLPSPSTITTSRVSERAPWAEDVFEVFKPRDLDFSQANLALILKDMPSAQRTALLSLLRHSRFKLQSITQRWASSKAFTDELDSYQKFKQTAVRLDGVAQVYLVQHVEDWKRFFRQLIIKNAPTFDPDAHVLRNAAGMRFYDGFNTGVTLENMQVLPKHLGLPPTRKKRSTAQNEWLAKKKRELLHKSLAVILGGWKDLAKTGFMLASANGPPLCVYPLPVVCPTDILEKGDLTLIDVMRHDVWTLAPVGTASNPRAAPASLRTEAFMTEVIRKARDAHDRGKIRKAARILKEAGTSVASLPAGAGFGMGVDIYQLVGHPDRLHQSAKGVMGHLLKLLKDVLKKREEYNRIDSLLLSSPPFPGMKLTKDGLSAVWATAVESSNVFAACLVPLLIAANSNGVLPILKSMAVYMRWDTLRDTRPHSDASLEALEATRVCFLESLPPGRNWNIPKVMAMAAFPESIRQLGSADVASTGLGEATHKGLKRSAKLSNRHEDSHLAQTGKQVLRRDTVAMLYKQAVTTLKKRSTGFVQRARLSKRVTFADGTLVHYSEGSQGTLTALRPLQPELGAQFRLALLMYLHRLAPSAASHVTDGKKIKVVRSMGIPYSKHRGVAEDAVGVRVDSTTPLGINSLPFMAVRASQGATDGMRWLCSVRLLFSFQFQGSQRRCAFVHWLETCPLPSRRSGAKAKEVEAHKALGMQRLRWKLVDTGGVGTNSESSDSDGDDSSGEGRHCPAARRGDHLCCVIGADDFDRPVFVQPDPTSEGCFYWNHHIR